MFVRFLQGSHKGEIAEMKYFDAIDLLNDGRAEMAFQDSPEPPLPAKTVVLDLPDRGARLIASIADAAKAKKGKRR